MPIFNFNTIVRRYTPPTCTLQVRARRSPLSRWQTKPVVKDLRFELRFDDPRQLRDRHDQIAIAGDRDQLEALCDAVATYIQDVVLQAPADTPLRCSPLLPSAPAPQPAAASELPAAPAADPVIPSLVSRARGLYLESHGLLQHQLHFGSLAPTPTQTSVNLSAVQLFDLAAALDDYSAEVEALPKLRRSTRLPGEGLPSWAGTAASVILALGLTTAAMRLSEYWQNQSVADAPPLAGADEPIISRSPLGLEAVPPLPSPLPVPTATLPPELEGLEILPPPGAVGRLDAPIPQTADTRYRGSGAIADSGATADEEATPAESAAAAPAPAPAAGETNAQRRAVLPSPSGTPSIPRNLPPVAAVPRQPALESAPAPRTPAAAPAPQRQSATARRPLPNLPQVAEVQQYFQGRWQPPDNLSGAVEYRLWLNRDGSLQRIAPATNAAATYLDRTRMPLLGEPFVSPLSSSGTPQIRLVLGADGSVQTYLEAVND